MSLSQSYNADRPDNKIPWFTSTVYTKSSNIRDHYLPTSTTNKTTTRSFHLFFTSSYQMVYGVHLQIPVEIHLHPHTALEETLAQLVQRHIGLCKKSLHVFAMAGRTLEMSTDTWAVMLQEYVQQLVYGEQEKVEGVFVNGPNVRSRLSNEFAHYAWHRIIYLISHSLQLSSSNFTLAMLGIGNLVDTFNPTLSGSNQQERSEKDSIDRINIVSQDVQAPKKGCREGLSSFQDSILLLLSSVCFAFRQ
ncbi:hypothetical protein EDC96DRAFT_599642 [Choanephora cucurbitarum]|nr:hypothetical protein EDC96DRAFT_599642 [Choanephora cucurbitarum]